MTVRARADDPVPLALADPDRVGQILGELVKNALRFSHEQPVDVTVGAQVDGTVQVSVADRGPGIHPDDRDAIFDRAYRGADSPGTGLGLYVAQVFAEAHGGRIDVESELGRGSTFSLVLPVASAPAPACGIR